MKKILLAVTGSVAVIKIKELQKLLSKSYEVKTIVSEYVKENFDEVKELNYIDEEKNLSSFPKHIQLAKWSNLIVVAPATTNTISKFNNAIADNALLSTLIASRNPIIFAPAMNTYMYKSLVERGIIENISNIGHIFLGPVYGKLREGETGLGRMMEPRDIKKAIDNYFSPSKEKVLIVNGSPKIYIDEIRYLSNSSTGKMGSLLANELRLKGFKVELLDISPFKSNDEILQEILKRDFSIYISPAAIPNFKTKKTEGKIKSNDKVTIVLEKDIDVLTKIKELRPKAKIIAFKHDDDKNNAIKKMEKLNIDAIIWNKIGSMGNDKIEGEIIFKEKSIKFNCSKSELAKKISNVI